MPCTIQWCTCFGGWSMDGREVSVFGAKWQQQLNFALQWQQSGSKAAQRGSYWLCAVCAVCYWMWAFAFAFVNCLLAHTHPFTPWALKMWRHNLVPNAMLASRILEFCIILSGLFPPTLTDFIHRTDNFWPTEMPSDMNNMYWPLTLSTSWTPLVSWADQSRC